jgi:hypothetical protein
MTAHPTGEAATYRIRVRGLLDPAWSGRLGGMTVAVWEGPDGARFAELTGPLADEAALMGVLEHLYSLRIPLLGVERVGVGRTEIGQEEPLMTTPQWDMTTNQREAEK